MFTGHKSSVNCGGFTPDGRLVVTGGGEPDTSLKVFDPKTGNCLSTTEGHGFHEAGERSLSSISVTGALHRD